jgi:outer membrane protein assembly factor BamB
MFASGDLAAFDLDGTELWSRDFGIPGNPYGHASSLATYQDLLIIQLDQGSGRDGQSRLFALRGATGETVWQAARAVPASWSTPIVVAYEGQPRIITCADPWVIAYAADDGREIWRVKCLEGDVGPSPVYADGVVYVANDSAVAAAIRDGGDGDVTQSHLLWSAEFGMPDICSPLVTDRHLLLIASHGGLVCYDRETGGEEPLWEEDLGAMLLASPSLVGDRVHLICEDGTGRVVKPSETGVEQIAANDLGEPCFTSPAFQSGRIYLRGEKHLFCLGE